jgi:hypothetical protein
VGAGKPPRFSLFADANEGTTRLLGQFAQLLEPALRAPINAGGAWLVRPDGYVACASAHDDIGVIAVYLDAILQRGSVE